MIKSKELKTYLATRAAVNAALDRSEWDLAERLIHLRDWEEGLLSPRDRAWCLANIYGWTPCRIPDY